jgi:hypothetical protein
MQRFVSRRFVRPLFGRGQATASTGAPTTTANAAATTARQSSVNNVTLVGVVHDVQHGFVFEDRVTQFVLTTTSIDTTNPAQECVVEKDHHTIRCYGDEFAEEVRGRVKDGNVLCVSGRLRLNPQLEPSCGKHFYFPYLHVQPPHGSVSVVHGDRRQPPTVQGGAIPTAAASAAPAADGAKPEVTA